MDIESLENTKHFAIHIKGLVQGVGFRPFIYRIATELNLKGQVENRNDGVFIEVNASDSDIKLFEKNIKLNAPPASQIQSITISELNGKRFNDFQIIKSTNISVEITQVSPDIAVCDDCIDDMQSQMQRFSYPFTNCTNCGPRFSIIKELPYDRPFTTMSPFAMCKICKEEYSDVLDRRFHAQPIACNHCGPSYQLSINGNDILLIDEIIDILSSRIDQGNIYAIKGIGGFHLMCDAKNEKAVARIREIKNRDGKPFAIMASSFDDIKKIANINKEERELLLSWQRPIVLLNYKGGLATGVSNKLGKIGVMLPYMPFHYQLFKKLKSEFIVLTSGNISDEPILIDNIKAHQVFKNKVDGILTYNRDIHNRVDDSVCMVINNTIRINRRSRGFAPQPILTHLNTEGIFGAGAELVNSFCIGKGNQAIMSQYLGDLKNLETLEFYEETFQRFEHLFRFKPELIATDLHPDYLSSQFAQNLSEKNQIPIIKVQHHHAHIASVMASQQIDENVIGVCFDGIGVGTDGKIWGAEFMLADLNDFERMYHFDYMPMIGGDKASKEPWRMAVAYLYQTFSDDFTSLKLPVFKDIESSKIKNAIQILKKNINTPLASSAGRLFDAVASIIGVCQYNSFQAEAPMRLESLINKKESGLYEYEIIGENISFKITIQQIVNDYINGISTVLIATKFHNTIIDLITTVCMKISKKQELNKVVLSGGTFQNVYLTENVEILLKSKGFEIYTPNGIPVNDQGIALGQLAIAAKKRELFNI